jgi:hypothetical protein
MRLSRWSSISLIAIALAACTDNIAPKDFAGAYNLNDINGRPLPTYEAPTPGLTRTIRGAGMSLDFGGTAQLVQAVTEFDGTPNTVTTNYTYRIKGNDLIFAFSPVCPCDYISPPPTGRVTSTGDLDLDMGGGDISIVYHFKRITLAY